MSPFFEDLEAQLRVAAERQTTTRRPSWWRRRRNLGLAAVAAVGLATPAVARVSGLWDPGVKPPPPMTVTISGSSTTCRALPPPAARRVPFDPALVRLLGVLRRPPGPEDIVPVAHRLPLMGTLVPDSVRFLGSVGEHRYFALEVLARLPLGCPTRRTRVKTMLCVYADSGGGGCGEDPESIRRGGPPGQSSSNHAGHAEFVSLVPDGVDAVSVRYGSSTRTFQVRSNFYGYEIAADPTQGPDEVTWHLRDGRERRFNGLRHP